MNSSDRLALCKAIEAMEGLFFSNGSDLDDDLREAIDAVQRVINRVVESGPLL